MDINNENEFYSNQHIYSESKIVNFLEKTDYIENYYKIDFILFLKIYPQLNDNTKNKIIKKINMDYFVLLLKNNLLDIENILLNENIFEDIDLTIELLFNSNFLGKFLKLTDYDKFIKIIEGLSFYNLYYIYDIIKLDFDKLKIFINTISYVCLDGLISKMDEFTIRFVAHNINFLSKLDLTGNLFIADRNYINEIKLSKLQIILLIGSTAESLIIEKIFKFEIDFIKKIINFLSDEYFLIFFNKSPIDHFYQYIKYVEISKLILVINENTNKHILNFILKEVNILYLSQIVPILDTHQIIDATYELPDDRLLIISKNLIQEHSNYFQFLYNNMPDYENSLPNVSKQILCLLSSNRNIKKDIINNFSKLNNSQIITIIKLFNSDDIFNSLKVSNLDQKNLILTNIDKNQINSLSDFIDRKLDTYSNGIENIREKILFKVISFFVKLNLSKKNILLIKNIE